MYILEFHWEWPFKTRVSSATSGLLSSCEGHLGILEVSQEISSHLEVIWGTQSFPHVAVLNFMFL